MQFTGGRFWGEVFLLLSEKAEACFHVLGCCSGTVFLLPLFLPMFGLWYLVALAGTWLSPVAREIQQYVINHNFGFLLSNDPYFGDGTFGQLVRFMAERVYVMVDQLSGLKEGGWKEKHEFSKYCEALEGVPVVSENSAD